MRKIPETNDRIIDKYLNLLGEGGTGELLSRADAKELFDAYAKLRRRLARIVGISDGYQTQIQALLDELQKALISVKTLKGFLPICASCKKIRNDDGYWKQLEQYISEHSEALFSHSICPECAARLYDDTASQPSEKSGSPGKAAADISDLDYEDPVVVRFLPLANDDLLKSNPLHVDFQVLFQKYARLANRTKRIAKISDSYQTQLRELTAALDRASHTDVLTGLSNRREIYERLEMERSRARRHGTGFSIMILDLDNFKSINDAYGHQAGDQLLVLAAKTLRSNLRIEDGCARWGGEEFLLILPELTKEKTHTVAEKLQMLLADAGITVGDTDIHCTGSFGIAAFRQNESIDDCIRRADAALYKAKHDGHNKTEISD